MEQKFLYCKHCGKIVAVVNETGVPVKCCGETMQVLTPNTVEASNEKHLPVYEREGNLLTVKVGSVAHPMEEKHYIQWVSLQTAQGNQRKVLTPDAAPEVKFLIADDDEVQAVYAYCNLHGLWKS